MQTDHTLRWTLPHQLQRPGAVGIEPAAILAEERGPAALGGGGVGQLRARLGVGGEDQRVVQVEGGEVGDDVDGERQAKPAPVGVWAEGERLRG